MKPVIKIKLSDKPEGSPISGYGTHVYLVREDGSEELIPGVRDVTIKCPLDGPVAAHIEVLAFEMSDEFRAILSHVNLEHFQNQSSWSLEVNEGFKEWKNSLLTGIEEFMRENCTPHDDKIFWASLKRFIERAQP